MLGCRFLSKGNGIRNLSFERVFQSQNHPKSYEGQKTNAQLSCTFASECF